jgi:hypothetical protein
VLLLPLTQCMCLLLVPQQCTVLLPAMTTAKACRQVSIARSALPTGVYQCTPKQCTGMHLGLTDLRRLVRPCRLLHSRHTVYMQAGTHFSGVPTCMSPSTRPGVSMRSTHVKLFSFDVLISVNRLAMMPGNCPNSSK